MSMLYWLHEGITHVLSDLTAVVPAVTVHAVCVSSDIWACSPARTSPGPTVLTASRPAPQVRTAASTSLPGGIRKVERRKTSFIPPAATSPVSGHARPAASTLAGRSLCSVPRQRCHLLAGSQGRSAGAHVRRPFSAHGGAALNSSTPSCFFGALAAAR